MAKERYRRHADGSVSRVSDGLTNLVANLGTSRDKAAATTYQTAFLSDQALMDAYRTAWLPRKIVDIPALDSCREWRSWQAEADQIEAIEAEEARLGIIGKVHAARRAARLFGGAALVIGTGDADPSKPLVAYRVAKGGLKYVTLIHKRQLAAGDLDRDVASPTFNQPAWWTIATDGGVQIRIHPSRLVFFRGAAVPDEAYSPVQRGWSDSVLLPVFEAVRNMDATAANVASLVFEAKVDTVGIPNFMASMGDPAYESQMVKRWRLAEMGKGINGTLMHDAEETLGQKSANFSSLPEVMDRFMQLASGACDIPMTRLLGQSPAGLSSTGESDLRNYYDRIRAEQKLEMTPAMALLDECLLRSAFGARPLEVHYEWRSLWQVTAKELAEIGKMNAETIASLRNTRLMPDQPLAETAVNVMTECGAMPGLEGAVAQYLAENPDEDLGGEGADDDEIAAAAMAAKNEAKPGELSDAAPRTLYVRRDVVNAAEIIEWAKGQGFKSTLAADDLHVTIAYSRKPVDWMKVGEAWEGELEVKAGGARLMERFGEARVLLFASSSLSWRHEEFIRAGATWDHPEYQPHITISYDPQSPDLANVEPYRGKIVLGPEIFEEVDEGWKERLVEK